MSSPLADALSSLSEREQALAAGDTLFRTGDPVRSLYLVVSGALRLTRSLPQGFRLTLQRAGPGAILAEASLFTDRYHCDAVAGAASVLRVVTRKRIEAAFTDDRTFAGIWTHHLAQEVQRARAHAETLSLKTVADRVDAWITLNGRALPAKGQWHQLAAEIGVTPEALYRELARRR